MQWKMKKLYDAVVILRHNMCEKYCEAYNDIDSLLRTQNLFSVKE